MESSLPKAAKAVVFVPTDIHQLTPIVSGQKPVADHLLEQGIRVRSYSSLRLELARKRGLQAHVIVPIPNAQMHDAWWMGLVAADCVFYTEAFGSLFTNNEVAEMSLRPWQKLYAKLGLPWSEQAKTPKDAKRILVDKHGVVDGALLNDIRVN